MPHNNVSPLMRLCDVYVLGVQLLGRVRDDRGEGVPLALEAARRAAGSRSSITVQLYLLLLCTLGHSRGVCNKTHGLVGDTLQVLAIPAVIELLFMPLSPVAAQIILIVLMFSVTMVVLLSCSMVVSLCAYERRRAQIARLACGICGPCVLGVWILTAGVAYLGWQLTLLPNLNIDEDKRRAARIITPATACVAFSIVTYVCAGCVLCVVHATTHGGACCRYALCRVFGRWYSTSTSPLLRSCLSAIVCVPCKPCLHLWCVHGMWQWPWSKCNCLAETVVMCRKNSVLRGVCCGGWLPCCCLYKPRRTLGDRRPESCSEVGDSNRASVCLRSVSWHTVCACHQRCGRRVWTCCKAVYYGWCHDGKPPDALLVDADLCAICERELILPCALCDEHGGTPCCRVCLCVCVCVCLCL